MNQVTRDHLFSQIEDYFLKNQLELLKFQEEYFKKFKISAGFDFQSEWALPLIPHLIAKNQYLKIENDLIELLKIFENITERYFGGDPKAHANYLKLNEKKLEMVLNFNHKKSNYKIARPDAILTDSSLKLMEINVDSGIGLMSAHWQILDFHIQNPLLQSFLKNKNIKMDFPNSLNEFGAYLSKKKKPLWLMPSRADFYHPILYFYDILGDKILMDLVKEIQICHPEELSLTEGKIFKNEMEIKSVYRYFSPFQLIRREIEFQNFLSVFQSNEGLEFDCPPTTLLIENKLNFALLCEKDSQKKMTAREIDLVERCLPKTFFINSHSVNKLIGNKSDWVLKKASSHGADHVVIGRDINQSLFDEKIKIALAEGDWLAQEFIASIEAPALFLVDKNLVKKTVPYTIHPFIIDRKLSGIIAHNSIYDPSKDCFLNSPGYKRVGSWVVSVV